MATSTSTPTPATQLNVVFDGIWILLPQVDSTGAIVGVNVYSPTCGHPHAALFLNQLGPFGPQNWPPLNSFYMLDNHGLNLGIRSTGKGISAKDINQSINHCMSQKRPMAGNWDLLVSLTGSPTAWVSTGTQNPVVKTPTGNEPCFSGVDAPTGQISSIQTLTFQGVTAAELCGAPAQLQGLLTNPYKGPGTLIFEGEVPYIPTLQHERAAISAMANLGGLDLLLEHPLPSSGSAAPSSMMQPRVAGATSCGHAIIFIPG